MGRSPLEQFLFQESTQVYLAIAYNYDPHHARICITFRSFDQTDIRVVQFAHVTQVVEETYEDFDGSAQWEIIGLRAERLHALTWHVTLQFLEKGVFFTSHWPQIGCTT